MVFVICSTWESHSRRHQIYVIIVGSVRCAGQCVKLGEGREKKPALHGVQPRTQRMICIVVTYGVPIVDVGCRVRSYVRFKLPSSDIICRAIRERLGWYLESYKLSKLCEIYI